MLAGESRAVWAALEFRRPMMLRNIEPLSEDHMRWIPGPGRNPIAWQLWHIAEVEDVWISTCLLNEEGVFPFGAPLREAQSFPEKAALLDYFDTVRSHTRVRLEAMTEVGYDAKVVDPDFGEMTARDLWAGVATSFAWHAGQIALTAKLIPSTPVSTWTFTPWGDGTRGGIEGDSS